MDANLISLFACFVYIATLILYSARLFWRQKRPLQGSTRFIIGIGLCGVALHGCALYYWIESPLGQNLSLSHLFSLVCWLMILVTLLLAFLKPVLELTLFILPLASLSIALALVFPGQAIFQTKTISSLIHILISVGAFGILGLAALQATLFHLQNRLLRNKSSHTMVQFLPPLQTTKNLLFNILGFGFLFLSASLISALLLLGDVSGSLLQKIILSILAWILFAGLLYNHYRRGLRGRSAIQWTLIGMTLLVASYLGNKLSF